MSPQPARPLAAHAHFESSDVDDVRELVARVYCQHRLDPIRQGGGRADSQTGGQTGGRTGGRTGGQMGALSAWQNAVRLSRVTVCAMGYGGAVHIDPGRLDTFYLAMLPYGGHADIHVGGAALRSTAATASLISPDDRVRMAWSADCVKLMVRIERDSLDRQLEALTGRRHTRSPRFEPAMPMDGRGATWWQYARLLIGEIERAGHAPQPSATAAQLESLLLTSLLETQAHTYSDALRSGRCGIAPRHVRLAERYIEDHAHEALGIEDLVAATGVSGRALYEGFQRFRDTSPMAHLRDVRLRRAREDLQSGGGATVAEIATRWQFHELGRFAGRYRRAFGETPSATLRRVR